MKETTLTRGERFKDARTVYNQHGHQTMAQVHKATGVSTSLIQELEDDSDRDFGYCKIVKLAEHYGVSIDWLLGLAPAKTVDPEIQGVCKYTGLSEASVKYLYSKQATNDPHIAHLIDSVLFSSDCDFFDTTHLELLGELLCSGSGVEDSIWGVLLDIADAKKRYTHRNSHLNKEQKSKVDKAKVTLSANGLLAISADVAYRHSIEMAVATFRQIVTGLIEKN